MNKVQRKVIGEVSRIPLQQLKEAFEQGRAQTLTINGRTILIEPAAPISGMTLFGEEGFVLGREAFTSEEELIKTLLHEIYRLETSTIGKNGQATQTEITEETLEAWIFAEKAILNL